DFVAGQSVPESDGSVLGTGGHPEAVWREAHRAIDEAPWNLKLDSWRHVVGVPNPDFAIELRGGQEAIVRRIRNGIHPRIAAVVFVGVLNLRLQASFAGLRVPEADELIPAHRGKRCTIGAERETVDLFVLQLGNLLVGAEVEDVCLRLAEDSRCNAIALGGEC